MRFLLVLFVFFFVFSYIPVAFASVLDEDLSDVSDDSSEFFPSSFFDDVEGSISTGLSPGSEESFLSSDYVLDGIEIFSLAPITAGDTSGLKSVMLDLIGPYDPVVVEYRYHNPNSSYDSYLREVQPDYVWMFSFGIFSLVVYCLFRMGGGFLGRR